MHIRHLSRLFKIKDYGPWRLPRHYDLADMYDRHYRYARYGMVFLQIRSIHQAMEFFWLALNTVGVVTGPNGEEPTFPNEPDQYIEYSMTILRANLCMLLGLPRKLISPEEFNRLDDLGQELLVAAVQEQWPDFDIVEHDIVNKLQRAYDVTEVVDVGGPPKSQVRTDGVEVVSLTEMVVGLCRDSEGRQKLCLGFEETGLWVGHAEVGEGNGGSSLDLELDAIEDRVAFSTGIIRPGNPR